MRVPCRVALLAIGLLGCGVEDESARRAEIVQTLVNQDRDLLSQRPVRVAQKYQTMSAGVQEFLRGTAVLFYRDLTRQLGDGTVRHGPGAEQVVLYGDPHIENVGSTPDDDGPVFDATDFDASVRGPFDWDVQRTALGLAVLLRLGGQGDAAVAPPVRAFAAAYLHAIAAAAGAPVRPLRAGMGLGAILEDVLGRGRRAIERREDLGRYTEVVDGRRRLLRDTDTSGVPAPFAGRLAEALAAYRQSRRGGPGDAASFVVKDAVERLNSGVASIPNFRFWLLVEGPAGEDDDWILEMKEERDPPAPLAWLGRGPISRPEVDWLASLPPPPVTLSNATRVASGALGLLSSPTLELDLGHVTFLGVPFLVRRATRARRNLDVADLAAAVHDGSYGSADLMQLGDALGRLLGAGHARGGDGAAILRAAGDPAVFAADTAQRALAAERRLMADLALFREALADAGPLLGAEHWVVDSAATVAAP